MAENSLKPNYIFEVSWEVCNKVGGIYTVVSTKALTLVEKFKDKLILIGPDIWKETEEHPEFTEDKFLFHSWREQAELQGLKFKIGRWNIAGHPIAILVDFTPFFAIKDKVFTDLWNWFELDSLPGQWDYIEPALFGYAAGKIIESFYNFHLSYQDKVIAQFHEWMTGGGILYLNKMTPQIGTVFTTHATAVARAIAGNGLPLYKDFHLYHGDTQAKDFGIVSKHSLEKNSAKHSDCFTTVSDLTGKECSLLLGKDVDIVTPNGFEDSFVPGPEDFDKKRKIARDKLLEVSKTLFNYDLPEDSVLIATSGRYEFKNKGIDVYIDSLGKLDKSEKLDKTVVAFLLVPASHSGARKELIEKLANKTIDHPLENKILTHGLHEYDYDPIIKRIHANGLLNSENNKVKIVFVPCYLNGNDGIFNISYYDLLIGFDLTVFPSYYELWGYTPLESIAFRIPTVTTSLSGFGLWCNSKYMHINSGVKVIDRNDDNEEEVVDEITEYIKSFTQQNDDEIQRLRDMAYHVSRSALWENLINFYEKAYSTALNKVDSRKDLFKEKIHPEAVSAFVKPVHNKPIWKKVFIKSEIPGTLAGLQKLANNIWWTWNYEAIELFEMINQERWEEFHHNPISLLESITFEEYQELESNFVFTTKLSHVLDKFNKYMSCASQKKAPKVAYFSMEFGLHESINIYSGGLGILAGDYLKQASDSNYDIVGIGLLYRYGYFSQSLSKSGDQLAEYNAQRFSQMPINPVRDENNNWEKISIALPGRTLYAKIWRIDVGRVPLYLLDTDLDENREDDRSVTHQLYGGNWENRLKQEILLGVGGIRLLDVVGIKPDLYHCNEGHAAFTGLERLRKYVQVQNFSFTEALEIVRASALFTTHTPVPAGHDSFSEDLLRTYIPHYASRLNISWNTFMNLGRAIENDSYEKFSMSVLATKLSQEVNGVSKIHGEVTRKMFNNIWEGYFPEELFISYVTNGVHLPTWASKKWQALYKKTFGDKYLADQTNKDIWYKIYDVNDEIIWDIRQNHRKELIDYVKERINDTWTKRQENPKTKLEIIENLNENYLTIGFARRFATYKRAYLLFHNIERLAEILNNKERPVQFIFAGKAHPNDNAGQELLKRIVEISKRPEFLGKIIFVEGYDIEVATKLVQGVDIWLNTPTRPLEASGTSGEKAIMNGVLNLSVLDGWWAEAYQQNAGWALPELNTYENASFQDELDAETIYNLLEDKIVPMFYERDKKNIPPRWISFIKNSIANIAPQFNMKRMLDDYINQYYIKLYNRSLKIMENDYEMVHKLSAWKRRILRGWDSIEAISIDFPDSSMKPLLLGETFEAQIILDLNELSDSDIGIEIVFGQKKHEEITEIAFIHEMEVTNKENGKVTYDCKIPAERSGVYDFSFRIFPKNELLPNRQDFYLLKWI
ncbi:MAG: alpha-glucan family phosphorylase [Bacteroidota bacterium]|nr:alpha-glucan family phosphorylase [Bacteroidota bacterium]